MRVTNVPSDWSGVDVTRWAHQFGRIEKLATASSYDELDGLVTTVTITFKDASAAEHATRNSERRVKVCLVGTPLPKANTSLRITARTGDGGGRVVESVECVEKEKEIPVVDLASSGGSDDEKKEVEGADGISRAPPPPPRLSEAILVHPHTTKKKRPEGSLRRPLEERMLARLLRSGSNRSSEPRSPPDKENIKSRASDTGNQIAKPQSPVLEATPDHHKRAATPPVCRGLIPGEETWQFALASYVHPREPLFFLVSDESGRDELERRLAKAVSKPVRTPMRGETYAIRVESTYRRAQISDKNKNNDFFIVDLIDHGKVCNVDADGLLSIADRLFSKIPPLATRCWFSNVKVHDWDGNCSEALKLILMDEDESTEEVLLAVKVNAVDRDGLAAVTVCEHDDTSRDVGKMFVKYSNGECLPGCCSLIKDPVAKKNARNGTARQPGTSSSSTSKGHMIGTQSQHSSSRNVDTRQQSFGGRADSQRRGSGSDDDPRIQSRDAYNSLGARPKTQSLEAAGPRTQTQSHHRPAPEKKKLFYARDLPQPKDDVDGMTVTYTCSSRRGTMYVQNASTMAALRELESRAGNPGNMTPVQHAVLSENMLVMVVYADDGELYRAQVLRLIDDQLVAVRYVDYGEQRKVARSQVFHLPEEDFAHHPPYCMKLRLWNVVVDKWDSEEFRQFEVFMSQKQLTVRLMDTSDEGDAVVDLSTPDCPFVVSHLKREVFRIRESNSLFSAPSTAFPAVRLTEGETSKFTVLHLDTGNSTFFVCRDEHLDLLDEVATRGSKKITTESSAFTPAIGQVVLIRYDDEVFRATVDAQAESDLTCTLLDFGKVVTVDAGDVLPLPNTLDSFPGLAMCFELDEDSLMVKQALRKHLELYESASFIVHGRKEDGTYLVELESK